MGTSSRHLVALTDEILWEINRIGLLRAPVEACGVLLPTPRVFNGGPQSQVVELPNRSTEANAYKLSTEDIKLEISFWAATVGQELIDSVCIWHTHPSGNIGPSPGDMKHRLGDVAYLVVALTDEGPVPTWF